MDDCDILLYELRVDEDSYLLSERMISPNSAENNLTRDEHGDLSYWADLGELGEEDFTEESIKRELEEVKKRLLEELHSSENKEDIEKPLVDGGRVVRLRRVPRKRKTLRSFRKHKPTYMRKSS